MNTSMSIPPIYLADLPPAYNQLGHEFVKATAFLLIPTELLYFSIYFHLKGFQKVYQALTFLSLGAFWISPWFAPISCGPAQCLQNFAIAIGSMKLLDIFARRHSTRAYTGGRRPADWLLSLMILTELRYESFSPNHIRVPRNQENFNEQLQLGIHIGIFTVLQSLPQNIPTVLAFEVQLSIYILWTSMQLLVRYKSSPALFGPLYLADSLSGFWSEIWHNAFASPCTSLAYQPLRYGLPKYGVPVRIARSLGILGAFGLMAIFHAYALTPILSKPEITRICLFFLLNGIATVAEGAVWGKKRHWVKAVLAWIFETAVSSWTAAGMNFPNGLSKIPWRDICNAPRY
ncbi:putative long-chain-alcohol O-fatty-acyltransferase 7 [Lachnellula arida]|uniref:Putative long-chain-alcohol O-fatty-acyltransferase 7 n=1 Tax=Lachnellula arida TaxID=1316785 RepID=A0A8T9BIU0_9HELO|nr:putative long-chain-alcohol O-fatty-acyltransferase 7 [Lachnellula arida]